MDVDGYADPYLASLYDLENGWHPSDDFYLRLVRESDAALDVGCGTGVVLGAAARQGHPGRLVGLDPSVAMIDRARTHQGVEWVHGTLPEQSWVHEFDLVTMTGHAFQELRTDTDVEHLLAAVRRVLRPGGRFAFETRNPHFRAWERWDGSTGTVTDSDGRELAYRYAVEDADGGLVTFSQTYTGDHLPEPLVARSTLRFLSAEHLDLFLADTDFTVAQRLGDWDGSSFTRESPEIITVAVRR